MSEAVTCDIPNRVPLWMAVDMKISLAVRISANSRKTPERSSDGPALLIICVYVPIAQGDFAVKCHSEKMLCRSFASMFVMFSQVSQTQV